MTTSPTALSPADQTAGDVLTCAIEGAINYWACVSDIERTEDLTITRVTIHEADDDGDIEGAPTLLGAGGRYRAEGVTVDLAQVTAALRRAAFEEITYLSAGVKATARGLLLDGGSMEVDYDANDADVIVQIAALGEIVYG